MKINISSQQWRLRTSREELDMLLTGGVLELINHLPESKSLRFSLQLLPIATASLVSHESGWQLRLPVAAIAQLATQLPQRDGVTFGFDGVDFTLEFQVDLHAGHAKRGSKIAAD